MRKGQRDIQKYFSRILIALFFGIFIGCSDKQIYDNLQMYQRDKCNQTAGIDRDACIKRTEKPYFIYEKEYKEYLSRFRKGSDNLE